MDAGYRWTIEAVRHIAYTAEGHCAACSLAGMCSGAKAALRLLIAERLRTMPC